VGSALTSTLVALRTRYMRERWSRLPPGNPSIERRCRSAQRARVNRLLKIAVLGSPAPGAFFFALAILAPFMSSPPSIEGQGVVPEVRDCGSSSAGNRNSSQSGSGLGSWTQREHPSRAAPSLIPASSLSQTHDRQLGRPFFPARLACQHNATRILLHAP
jgi:hypothetical protein